MSKCFKSDQFNLQIYMTVQYANEIELSIGNLSHILTFRINIANGCAIDKIFTVNVQRFDEKRRRHTLI